MRELFRVRESAVASEIIDGEAIILQLRTGHYFSARGSGAAVWSLFMQSVDFPTIAQLIADATGVSVEHVLIGVRDFAAEAERHSLGTVDLGVDEGERASIPLDLTSWEPPVLEVFSDMQDLLLLDPIHDVSDEAGWPVQKPVA